MVSIITITYNNLNGLKKTVESVLCQSSYDNIEYIIIDGASTDGTSDYLITLPNSVRWISEKDRGISHAFNKGIKMATGDMILCLNAGDTFYNRESMKKVFSYISVNSVDIISFKVSVDSHTSIPYCDDESTIWAECEEPHQGTFVSSKVYEEIGGYSEEYSIRMDYHFFARCRQKNYKFKYYPEIIVEYEPGGVSMKKENRHKFWKEGMAVKLLFGLKYSFKDFIKFVLYAR